MNHAGAVGASQGTKNLPGSSARLEPQRLTGVNIREQSPSGTSKPPGHADDAGSLILELGARQAHAVIVRLGLRGR